MPVDILPVQVKYESDNIIETKIENRRSNSEFQYHTETDEKRR